MNGRESERESEKARESARERASERVERERESIYNEKFLCFYGVCRLPHRLEFFVTSAQNLHMKGLLLAHVLCERKNDGLSLSLSHKSDYSKPMTSMISTANSRRLLLFDPAIANV